MIILKRVYLLLSIFLAINSLESIQYSDRNYLIIRAPGKDLFFKELGLSLLKRKTDDSYFRGTLQVVPFYQRQIDKPNLGRYFGALSSSNITYGNEFGSILTTPKILHDAIYEGYHKIYPNQVNYTDLNLSDTHSVLIPNQTVDFIYTYQKETSPSDRGKAVLTTNPDFSDTNSYPSLVQAVTSSYAPFSGLPEDYVLTGLVEAFALDPSRKKLSGDFTLKPDKKTWGALFSYNMQADNYWIQIDLPFLSVKQQLKIEVDSEDRFKDSRLQRDVGIKDLLEGKYELIDSQQLVDNPNEQEALKFLKFSSSEFEKRGIGDPDITLGIKLIDYDSVDCDVFAKISVPVSKTIENEYIYPIQLGENGHWKFGIGGFSSADIVSMENFSLEAFLGGCVDYHFEKEETRILNFISDSKVALPWSKYLLVAKNNSSGPLKPFANVSSALVKVAPGLSGECFCSLGILVESVSVNVGCSIFFKQGENLDLKKWNNANLYGPPSVRRYRTTQIYDPNRYPLDNLDGSTIHEEEINLELSSTPASISKSFYAQVSAQFAQCSFSLGGSYETCQENSALNNLTGWMKASIAF